MCSSGFNGHFVFVMGVPVMSLGFLCCQRCFCDVIPFTVVFVSVIAKSVPVVSSMLLRCQDCSHGVICIPVASPAFLWCHGQLQ